MNLCANIPAPIRTPPEKARARAVKSGARRRGVAPKLPRIIRAGPNAYSGEKVGVFFFLHQMNPLIVRVDKPLNREDQLLNRKDKPLKGVDKPARGVDKPYIVLTNP